MSGKTLYLEGLDELEPGDVLYWLKETLARDLAAMRTPKSEEERVELLNYAMRRIGEAATKIPQAIWATRQAMSDHGSDADSYYDQDGDPPWKPLPDWAAS